MTKRIVRAINEAYDESIQHYIRMIKWAMNQKQSRRPNRDRMDDYIGEHWGGVHCSYCNRFFNRDSETHLACSRCPLATYTGLNTDDQFALQCCAGLWTIMDQSRTWEIWVDNAKNVLTYIIIHGLRVPEPIKQMKNRLQKEEKLLIDIL